jgi:hypothetical protein
MAYDNFYIMEGFSTNVAGQCILAFLESLNITPARVTMYHYVDYYNGV